jgi:hypothetical protein
MANQKYTGMKTCAYCCGYWCCQWRSINYTLATTATSISNVRLSYCTLGANPNYSVVSTNGTLSVTQSIAVTVIADGKSKVYGDENLRLLLVNGAVNGDTTN